MPPARHWDAPWPPASKFPSPASRASRTKGIHCAHLFSPRALSPAACTRSGSRDRNTCTACTNAIRTRTSDIFRPRSCPATQCRIARSAKPRACRADSPAEARVHDPTSAARSCAPAAASAAALAAARGHDRCPDIPVDGISPQTLPKHAAVFSRRATPSASTRIGDYHSPRIFADSHESNRDRGF
jgi:hypothetical protein